MSTRPIDVLNTGLVSAVGLNAPAGCAAIRAGLSNPTETRFIDSAGEWIMAQRVPHERPWFGLGKLATMAAIAIEEALLEVPKAGWRHVPLMLCVAEEERVGRTAGLTEQILPLIEEQIGAQFSPESTVIPAGRVGAALALTYARDLIYERAVPLALVAATDSLLSWPTLSHYERSGRLLTSRNSNGFIPGEGAGAALVGPPSDERRLQCTGIGFGREPAHIDSEIPLRGDGLTEAVKTALADAGIQMHQVDWRIADISGEHYYFKEAALLLSRTLSQQKKSFDLWHPAESTGEAGALAGIAMIAVTDAAFKKDYAPGPAVVAHMSADAGQRAALTLQVNKDR